MSKENVCLCGHLKVSHLGRDSRKKCTGTTTALFGTFPPGFATSPNVKKLSPHNERDLQTWNRILKELRPGMREKAKKRGYVYLDCSCPMFHLVELGQIKLERPR